MNSIEISNFKNFGHLKINNLGLVNLIVGQNNSGKSTLLEAISLLASGANIGWIKNLLELRGINFDLSNTVEETEMLELENLCTLYHNYDCELFKTNPIKIISKIEHTDSWEENSVEIRLVELVRVIETTEDNLKISRYIIRNSKNEQIIDDSEVTLGLQVSFNENKTTYPLGKPRRKYFGERVIPFEYVKTAEFTGHKNPSLFDKIALTPLEPFLIEALHIVDPRIEDLNFLNDDTQPRLQLGLRDQSKRIPYVVLNGSTQKYRLSTMGDGINRILTIILSMLNCREGILLVDEFENGLHYSVQTVLWELVCRLAQQLNIQVFATTHSNDCIKSFLSATQNNRDLSRLIRLEQRKSGEVAVMYDEADELDYINFNNIETR